MTTSNNGRGYAGNVGVKVRSRNDLRKCLASIGASLDGKSSEFTLTCDAPSGYVWRANNHTSIAIHYATSRQSWLAKAIREDGLPRLKLGLIRVTDPVRIAEIRHYMDDDQWGASCDAPEVIQWPTNPVGSGHKNENV